MQLTPPVCLVRPLAGVILLFCCLSLLGAQGAPPAMIADIFFLDLGIVIEPVTGKEQYSRLIESPSKEVKFRINKVKSGSVYMTTSKEMMGTLDRINLRIASLESSFHAEMNRLQHENEELRVILTEMRNSSRSPAPKVTQPITENIVETPETNRENLEPVSAEPKTIEQSVTVAPENKIVRFDQTEYMAGVFAYQRENFAAALEHFSRLVMNDVSLRTKANVLYWQADSHQRLAHYDTALNILDEIMVLGKTDRHDDALIQKGLLYRKIGQEEQALFAFGELVDKYPGSEYIKLARMELKKAEMVP